MRTSVNATRVASGEIRGSAIQRNWSRSSSRMAALRAGEGGFRPRLTPPPRHGHPETHERMFARAGRSAILWRMDKSRLPRELRPFVDETGRLRQWPSRFKVQRMAAALLATRFEPGREYAEKDVNFTLMDGHTFADWALLRRFLVDWG